MRALLFFTCAFLLIHSNPAFGQFQDPNTLNFKVLGKTINGNPTIKIIPGNQAAWFLGMHTGYTISVSEFNNDQYEPFTVVAENLKPGTREDFANPDLPQEYASAMQKIIYEQTYAPPGQSFDDLTKANENMGRHYFAYVLFSSYNPVLSQLSGLQLTLPSQLTNRFIVKIEIPGSDYAHQQIMNKNLFYTDFESPDIEIDQGDKNIQLSWDHKKREDIFAAYILERSKDGFTFDQIGIPHTFNKTSQAGKLGRISVTDSVPLNYATYSYRVRGYDGFGYLSEPRAAKAVYGKDMTPPAAPKQVQVAQLSEKEVSISWISEIEADLAGFQVIASSSEKGVYHRMHEELLSSSTHNFDFTFAGDPLTYYRVLAVDTANNASASDLGYLVVYDTIPPDVPGNIVAVADTNLIVSIKWAPVADKNLKGYRVYKAYHPTHGFVPITPVPVAQSNFTDTLPKDRLEKKVYYQIVALDGHFNHSQPSKTVSVEIPDFVPPTSPLLIDVDLDDNATVHLMWKASSSADVEKYHVMRRLDKDSAFANIGTVGTSDLTYRDKTFSQIHTSFGEYYIVAQDSSGNISEPSNAKRILNKSGSTRSKIEIKSAVAQENQVQIEWDFPTGNVYDVLVYRADDNETFELLDRVHNENGYTDKTVRQGFNYQYKIGLIGNDGYRSPLSKRVAIELK